MRHASVKIRTMCYVIVLNCILVPFVLKYWMCWHHHSDKEIDTNKEFMLKIPVGEKKTKIDHRK